MLMRERQATFLNTGIYSIPEASRLTRVSKDRIRRWLRGYHSELRGKNYPPLWKSQLPSVENTVALGFLDLMEIKFVDAFLRHGVSWAVIHKVREKAQEIYPDTDHPFCTKQFFTDGRQIFRDLHAETGEECLQEIATNQIVFSNITRPFFKELEFEGEIFMRWWPLGKDRQVVIDPRKNFGQPTIFIAGVPTQSLHRSYLANGSSYEEVARWYEIGADSVREAVDYEQSLAA
jgi:uncharacterized protein (DUF433 family)